MAEACAFYLERLKPYAKVELIELKDVKAKTPDEAKRQEGEELLKAASGYLIALDEKGQQFSSEDLAQTVSKLENNSISTLSLLIGGADGHSEIVRKQAEALWSLSKLTLPHEMARLVLLEQLYRLETIRAGHPYHRP